MVEFDILFEYLEKKKGLLYVYINYVVVFFRSMFINVEEFDILFE